MPKGARRGFGGPHAEGRDRQAAAERSKATLMKVVGIVAAIGIVYYLFTHFALQIVVIAIILFVFVLPRFF